MSEFTYINDGEQGKFPSLEQLNRYLNGEMSEQERVEMESRMVDDPLFADVMEGLSHVGDAKGLNQAVSRIKTESRTRLLDKSKKRQLNSKRKSRVQPRTYTQLSLSIAAGISLLIVSVWLVRGMIQMRQSSMEDLLATESAKQEAPIASTEDTQPQNEVLETLPPSVQEPSNQTLQAAPPQEEEISTEIPETEYSARTVTAQPASPIVVAGPERQEREDSPSDELADNFSRRSTTGRPLANKDRLEEETISNQPERDITEASPLPKNTNQDPAPPVPVEPQVIVPDQVPVLATDTTTPLGRNAEVADKPYFSKEELAEIQEHEADDVSYTNSVILQEKMKKEGRSRRKQAESLQKKTSKIKDNQYSKAPAMTEEERIKAKRSKATILADLLKEAAELQQEGKYEEARTKLQEVLDSSPGNESAMYMMAQNYIADLQPELATSYFKSILDNRSSKIYFDAKWDLIQNYLLLDRPRPAKRLLQSMSENSNPYQEKAQSQLDSLKNR